MRSLANVVVAIVLGGCGGPALQNVPHPNSAMMAGAAAAVAGAITLADPSAPTNGAPEPATLGMMGAGLVLIGVATL